MGGRIQTRLSVLENNRRNNIIEGKYYPDGANPPWGKKKRIFFLIGSATLTPDARCISRSAADLQNNIEQFF